MSSFYTSLSGLRASQTDLNTIAHNIANAETTGFKKSSAEFVDLVANGSSSDPRKTQGLGVAVSGVTQNFSLGAIDQTGRALDVAIDGDGFFATRNIENNQILFTRNGNFAMDPSGNLNNAAGQRMQGFPVDATGTVTSTASTIDITVPLTNAGGAELTNVSIEKNGLVIGAYTDGTTAPIARMALATFTAPTGLRAVGSTNWENTGSSGAPIYELPSNGRSGALLSGTLERSNVDIAEEMVGLITAQRNFQANARAIDTATQFSQTIINLRN